MLICNVLIYCVKNARLLPKHPLELVKKELLKHPLFMALFCNLHAIIRMKESKHTENENIDIGI